MDLLLLPLVWIKLGQLQKMSMKMPYYLMQFQEKMKEINEAYDAITKERANGGTQYKTYSQPGSTSSGSCNHRVSG